MPMADKSENKSFFRINLQKYKKYRKLNVRIAGVAQIIRSRLNTIKVQQ